MTKGAADLDYDQSHELRPGLRYPPGDAACFTGAPVELHLLPAEIDAEDVSVDDVEPDRAAREALLVARLIRQMSGADGSTPRCVMEKQSDGSLKPRPIRFGDIVVLLRAMRYKGDDFADVLRASGIPVHSETGSGYFDSMEVSDMLALLKVLDNRRQDIPLAGVLRSPLASLPEPEDALARIRLAYPDKLDVPFHEAVMRYAFDGTHDDELAAKLRDVIAQLNRWREMAQRRPLAELIWDIYDSTGYLAFCAGLRDGEQRKANLIDLHERARQFGSFQRQGLARFLSFLQRLRVESDLGQPSVAAAGENVVRIMTVHRSKGLEFPVVIMPDLGKGINLQSCGGSILFDRHAHLGMDVVDEAKQVRYPSLASMLVSSRLRQQAMAEELRVLYVGMTRAREHLVLMGTCKPTAAESWEARWTGHLGPIPADEVISARCMLDWVGPVAAAIRTAASAPVQIIPHTAEEVAGWPSPEKLRPAAGERVATLARLEPLRGAEADPAANEIIARLTTPYAHRAFTELAASQAATALTKHAIPARPASEAPPAFERAINLELPRAVRTELKPDAADIGSATHLVLQHLDFSRACDGDDVRAQLGALVEKRLIAETQATAVDVDSICWVVRESEVGKLMRDASSIVRRELPMYYALDCDGAASEDPQDRMMIRSRIDALIDSPAGLHIVDYKTDRVTDANLQERAEFYRPQMTLYRDAIQAITSRKVLAIHMVFLSVRKIVPA
jgi:ATP-dependent helicase/nuclease subunit A